jgi:hypothetical protein
MAHFKRSLVDVGSEWNSHTHVLVIAVVRVTNNTEHLAHCDRRKIRSCPKFHGFLHMKEIVLNEAGYSRNTRHSALSVAI